MHGKKLQCYIWKTFLFFDVADWIRTLSTPTCGHLFQLELRVTQERSWQHNVTAFLICLQTCREASYLLSAGSCSIQNYKHPAQHSLHTWSPTHSLSHPRTSTQQGVATRCCPDKVIERRNWWTKKREQEGEKGHNKENVLFKSRKKELQGGVYPKGRWKNESHPGKVWKDKRMIGVTEKRKWRAAETDVGGGAAEEMSN